jgi:hypothetical protein
VGNDLTLNGLESTQDALDVQATVANSLELDSTEVGNDVVSITGARDALTATMAAVEEGNDVSSIVADVVVIGSVSGIEDNDDVIEVNGNVALNGTIIVQEEGQDVCGISSQVLVHATVSCQEVGDDLVAIRIPLFFFGRVFNPTTKSATRRMYSSSSTRSLITASQSRKHDTMRN